MNVTSQQTGILPVEQARRKICQVQNAWPAAMLCLFLVTSVANAQEYVNLQFPASRVARIEPANVWLVAGGHTFAVVDSTSFATDQRTELPDSVISSVANVGHSGVIIAGTHGLEWGMVGYYDLAKQEFLWLVEDLPHPVTAAAVVDDKRLVIGQDSGELAALDLSNGETLWREPLHSKMVTSLSAIVPDMLASSDWAGKIVLLDPSNGKELASFQQHRDRVVALEAPAGVDPPRLLSASRDGTVRLWYPTQRRLVRFVQFEQPLTAMTILTAELAVVATSDARLHVLDMDRAVKVAAASTELEYVTGLERVDARTVIALDGKGRVVRIAFALPDGEVK